MPLFQTSVLKNHLALLYDSEVDKAYKKYQNYFWNTIIQENIKTAKEEQYQATFLHELFVNILGYTLFPNPDSNLTTEFKNEKNQRKADGAILKDGVAIGVIELKGTNTKDLESIRRQAFDYKANHKGCIYVITSNFEKLRFYINDATEFEEFDLFTLSKERFKLMYLCLHLNKIVNNTPLKIKEASIAEEQEITKTFYKDYSLFKRELYRDLVKNNSQTVRAKLDALDDIDYQNDLSRLEKNVKLTLFQKSQKLIDRFLFIFFAEDRMLLPSNSTLQILNKWKDDNDFGDERPLYDLFKQYFHFLDTGRKGTASRAEIYAYNGGLFKPDAILDALEIDSELLYSHTRKLSNYDFESQVDVNILGHIFENSLNEIESVSAEIEGGDFDKQTSKRKKDGVFYTPKYITKYIVENTIGKLCEEKKIELDFHEEEYFKGRKNRNKTTIENLVHILDDYRDWLLQLTICDPACGSGAFLNQALDFLIKEHTYIDELKTKLLGGGLQFPDIENTILENNIYGVDLNEESVEIAKLSLWLRTAQPRRKLNDLNSNIKCGNSLIDDVDVAGDKAFNWHTEFPEIFKNGGFDVVIGNPPYVNLKEFDDLIHSFFSKEYNKIHTGYNDLMYYFLYKGIEILNSTGTFGVITSNYFIGNEYAQKLRSYLSLHINVLINFSDYHIFRDANIHTTIIFADAVITSDKVVIINYKSNLPLYEINLTLPEFERTEVERQSLNNNWLIANRKSLDLIKKIELGNKLLGTIAEIAKGSESGKNEVFTINDEIIREFNIERSVLRKCIKNSDIDAYIINKTNQYIIYTDNDFSKNTFPNAYRYLKVYKETLLDRRGPKNQEYEWWRLHRPSVKSVFDAAEKLLVPYRADKNRFGYDNKQLFNNGGDVRAIVSINDNYPIKFIAALLNSKLLNWHYGFIGKPKGNSREYFNKPLSLIPIKNAENKQVFALLVDQIIEQKKSTGKIMLNFQKYLFSSFGFQQFTRKLQNWHNLSFGEFIKELNKAIKASNRERAKEAIVRSSAVENPIPELTKKDEFEWMELFEENKKKVQEMQDQIETTEKEIDQMVYELYGLTEEEIGIVENG
ncbi:Eco57I restriction-modification methylase domain-containing protein [Mariniflexile ostreae]|uniref:site-specific DNA-methyltransferase (adenine-specific) n=1 Tax=Mariniflexile ostreae TaxID=1520892 RepID=A0ABV5FAS6_9FLAO